ncbi:MAG: ABC transporter permease [Halanaerobiaceae bacterium]
MRKRGKNRVLEYLITLLIIITLNFILPRLMPGDPFLFISADQGQDLMYSEEQRQQYLEYYGLNKPIIEQYLIYLSKVVKGNMGISLYYNESVINIILRRLIWTFFLLIISVIISTTIGMILGSISAWYRNTWLDKLLYTKLIALSEIPSFLLGLILLFVFAAGFNIFPLSGAITHYAEFNNIWEKVLDVLHHAVLPIIALSFTRLGGIYLLGRNSVISVLNKDYIKTGQAKGLSKTRILANYVIRNALLPVITRVFLSLGGLVGGAILVENVFAYPGLGHLMRESVMVRDYPLIQGIFLTVSIFVLTANYLADLVYVKIDPRIKDNSDKAST